jgi:hypothetical protein
MEVLLKRNKIEFAYADASQIAKGFYQTQESQKFTIEINDLIEGRSAKGSINAGFDLI